MAAVAVPDFDDLPAPVRSPPRLMPVVLPVEPIAPLPVLRFPGLGPVSPATPTHDSTTATSTSPPCSTTSLGNCGKSTGGERIRPGKSPHVVAKFRLKMNEMCFVLKFGHIPEQYKTHRIQTLTL